MQQSEWLRFKAALNRALDAPENDRQGVLDNIGGRDPRLREQLEEWLAAEEPARRVLDRARPLRELESLSLPLEAGTRIGRYSIQGVLGVGGSSLVYTAEQDEPKRSVALKVLQLPAEDEKSRKRFLEEARFLASLSHPGIAQVYEAGVHRWSHGTVAYIAMERVPGATNILQYVEREKPNLNRRLELAITIADAIGHAHEAGVVHRDVKPANILVDPAGRVKVIDFGIGRWIDQGEWTRTGGWAGTLAYMSPEQFAGVTREIHPSSDVYSIGVVLYELLCGASPYPKGDASVMSFARQIQDLAPVPPTQCNRKLGRDLEAILLKALEKKPTRRYDHASELAADLRRYRSHQPVHAREANLGYFLRVFARRHRRWVLASVIAFFVLGAVSFHQWRQAVHLMHVEATERANVQRVKDFLLSMLQQAQPGVAGRNNYSMRDALDQAAPRIDETLAASPEACAEVHATFGRAYAELDLPAHAEHHYRRMFEIFRTLDPEGSDPRVCTQNMLGYALTENRKYDEAIQVLKQAYDAFEGTPDCPRWWRGISASHLSKALYGAGLLDESEKYARIALQTYADRFSPEHMFVAGVHRHLGRVLCERRRFAEAETHARKAVEIYHREGGDDSLDYAKSLAALGRILLARSKFDEARPALEIAAANLRKLLSPDHSALIETQDLLQTCALP